MIAPSLRSRSGNLFGYEIGASLFSATRPMPMRVAQRLANAIARRVDRKQTVRNVVDAGCGVGRFIPAFERGFRGASFTAVDSSLPMLEAAARRLVCSNRRLMLRGDLAERNLLRRGSTDVVIMHWVLNATAAWQTVIENAKQWLRDGGCIVWFEEQGSLYDLVDDAAGAAHATNIWSPAALDVWSCYRERLGEWGTRCSLSRRVGISVAPRQVREMFQQHGFSVTRLHGDSVRWTGSASLAWMVHRVLLERAFSNSWLIPDAIHSSAATETRKWLARYPLAAAQRETLPFSATPVVATVS